MLARRCEDSVTGTASANLPTVESNPGAVRMMIVTKRYELNAEGKQASPEKALRSWKKAQSRLHEGIAPKHIRALEDLSELKYTFVHEMETL